MNIKLKLYNLLKPILDRLERAIRLEVRKAEILQIKIIAERIVQRYREKTTPEIRRGLRRRPPVGGCSHLKGKGHYINPDIERVRHSPYVLDYNVSQHTYPDGRTRIRCNRCGEIRWQEDAGFSEFQAYVQQSSNSPSSSEVLTPGIKKNYISLYNRR